MFNPTQDNQDERHVALFALVCLVLKRLIPPSVCDGQREPVSQRSSPCLSPSRVPWGLAECGHYGRSPVLHPAHHTPSLWAHPGHAGRLAPQVSSYTASIRRLLYPHTDPVQERYVQRVFITDCNRIKLEQLSRTYPAITAVIQIFSSASSKMQTWADLRFCLVC